MKRVNTNRIISAFANAIDRQKVEDYAITMRLEMLSHSFPAIIGYSSTITDDDVENPDLYFMDGEKVTEEHIGIEVWYVTDGHHRTLAAIEAQLPYLMADKDYNACVSAEEIEEYRKTH